MKTLYNILLTILIASSISACTKGKTENQTTDSLTVSTDTAEVTIKVFQSDENFKASFSSFYSGYLKLSDAFVASDVSKIIQVAGELNKSLSSFETSALDNAAQESWKSASTEIEIALREIGTSKDLELQRVAFSTISNHFYQLIRDFGIKNQKAYYTYCPMAFNDKGAYWISSKEEIRNPYFGDKMLTCGVVKEELN